MHCAVSNLPEVNLHFAPVPHSYASAHSARHHLPAHPLAEVVARHQVAGANLFIRSSAGSPSKVKHDLLESEVPYIVHTACSCPAGSTCHFALWHSLCNIRRSAWCRIAAEPLLTHGCQHGSAGRSRPAQGSRAAHLGPGGAAHRGIRVLGLEDGHWRAAPQEGRHRLDDSSAQDPTA